MPKPVVAEYDPEDIQRWLRNGMRDAGCVVWIPVEGTIWRDGREERWELKGSADEDCLDLAERGTVRLWEERSRRQPTDPNLCFGGIIGYPRVGRKALHVLVMERRTGQPKPGGAEVDHIVPDGAAAPDRLNVCSDYLELVPRSVNRRRAGEHHRARLKAAGRLKSSYPGVSPYKNGFIVGVAGFRSTWARTLKKAIFLSNLRSLRRMAKEEEDWDQIGGPPPDLHPESVFIGGDSTKRLLEHMAEKGQISKEQQRKALKHWRERVKEYRAAVRAKPLRGRSRSRRKPIA